MSNTTLCPLRPYMFKNKKLLTFRFPTNIDTICAYIFEYSKVYCDLIIPNNIKQINPYAFKDMGGNCQIRLPSSITELNPYTFLRCTAIKTIRIPLNVKIINCYAFEDCSYLEELYIPHHQIEVFNYCFKGCNNLKRVLAPDNVISVLGGAFSYYKKMSEVPLEMRLRTYLFWKIKYHHSLCIREEKEFIHLVLLCGEILYILPTEIWILILEFIEFGNIME